jgi:hypothetical protein
MSERYIGKKKKERKKEGKKEAQKIKRNSE